MIDKAPVVCTSHNCILSALWTFFSRKDINYNDAEIFILGNGVNLKYNLSKKEFDIPDIMKNLGNFGIKYQEVDIDFKLEKQIKEYIMKYSDIIVHVRTNMLNYNPFYMKEENEDKTHFIIISRTDNGEELYVTDPHFTNNYTYKLGKYIGITNMQMLLNAGIKAYYLDVGDLSYINKNELVSIFKKELRDFLSGYRESDYEYGITGIFKFGNDIYELSEEELLQRKCSKIHYQINICSVIYVLKSVYLIIEKLLKDEDFVKTKNDIEELINKWVNYSFYLLSSGIKEDYVSFMNSKTLFFQLYFKTKEILEYFVVNL